MKFNTKELIRTPNGDFLNENGKNTSMGDVISNILFGLQKDQATAYRIGMSILNSGKDELELTSEDVVFIKKTLEEVGMSAFIYGQIVAQLEK